MMQPSLPPPPNTKMACSSIYDAIKDDDWEGLLTLYATTAYDAVHSAEFALQGDSGSFHRQQHSPSSPSSPSSILGGTRIGGIFRDEKKMEGVAHHLASSFHHGFKKSSLTTNDQSSFSSHSAIRELDLIVREIIGADTFDEHHRRSGDDDGIPHETIAATSHPPLGEKEYRNNISKPLPSQQGHSNHHTNKKTRLQNQQHLPTARKSLPTTAGGGLSSALDHILFHNSHNHFPPTPNSSSRREKDLLMDWEKVLWESACVLSNSCPSPTFVVQRRDRDRREEEGEGFKGVENTNHGGLKSVEGSMGSSNQTEEDEKNDRSSTLIFEGNVANATPAGDNHHHHYHNLVANNGGAAATAPPGGSGTAQHLACLLDSPLALAVLVCLGADCTARHTAFRRLPIHEAACADSPGCLGLLMELGTMEHRSRCSEEFFGDWDAPAVSCRDGSLSLSRSFAASASAADGFDSSGSFSDSFSGEIEERTNHQHHHPWGKKSSKKKLNLFSGWHKGKTPGGGSGEAASSSILKKSSSSPNEQQCQKTKAPPSEEVFTSFPTALKVMWEAIKLLRSGVLMNEMDAAHYIMDRVKVSNRTMAALALQCPLNLPPLNTNQRQQSGGEVKAAAAAASSSLLASSPAHFASIPGLSSAVHQLFQQQQPSSNNNRQHHHARDNILQSHSQSSFPKRNVDGHGNTPLHWAAFKNSVRALDILLSPPNLPHVDVSCRASPSGWTPLHDAAYSDAADAIDRLIAAGAAVDARSHSGATPLCFAAQEDAPNATRRLLAAGADPAVRCLGNGQGGAHAGANAADDVHLHHSRFSGYTPLHYCAHYNAAKAARVLLYEGNSLRRRRRNSCGDYHLPPLVDAGDVGLLEILDLNEKLPIHVAVARGSSLVLRELLHGGARVETPKSYRNHAALSSSWSSSPPYRRSSSPRASDSNVRAGAVAGIAAAAASTGETATAPVAIPTRSDRHVAEADSNEDSETTGAAPSTSPPAGTSVITPVSSPVLRAMIPSQPIASSKPWNCLSQKSIDACKHLIEEVEMNWAPERHVLFAPADRVAVVEVLRVGKRLERVGRGIFLDLWPHVLSFCGRGWFEPVMVTQEEQVGKKISANKKCGYEDANNEEEISMQCSMSSSGESSGGDDNMEEFTQFQFDETNSMETIL